MNEDTLTLALLLLVLAPLVVMLWRDLHGCTRNCRQGRGCDCEEKTK